MNFKGVIIEESLKSKKLLDNIEIIETRIEKVGKRHKTPWLKKWTLHTVSIPQNKTGEIAKKISQNLDYEHGTSWYADFNNGEEFFVIYKDRIFKWKKGDREGPQQAKDYGISLGIPEYQVDFPSD